MAGRRNTLDRHLRVALRHLRLARVPARLLPRLDTLIRKAQALCEDAPEGLPRKRRVRLVQTELPFRG
jgi:hypothetical protein